MATILPPYYINIPVDASVKMAEVSIKMPRWWQYQMFKFEVAKSRTIVDLVDGHQHFNINYLSSKDQWYHLDEGDFYFRIFGDVPREVIDATRIYVRGEFGVQWHDFLEQTLG